MIGKRKKNQILVVTSIILVVTSFLSISIQRVENVEPFFTLEVIMADRVFNPPFYLDYLNFIRQHLWRIGINLDIHILEWNDYITKLTVTRDFDMVILPLDHIPLDDLTNAFFTENGSLNVFGYSTDMDFDESLETGNNEWLIDKINTILPPNSIERYETVWDWQFYLMEKIVPCFPLFSDRIYQAYWSNLQGYDFTKGLIQNWGYLSWDGIHQGQISANEIVVEDSVTQNPISVAHKCGWTTIPQLAVLDPLIWLDGDRTYWPHLAKDWTHITDNQVRLTLREGIKWQDDPDGNFTNEYFDAHDVYFTLNIQEGFLHWLEDYTIVNSSTIDLFINSYPDRNQPVDQTYLGELAYIKMLPEHYLNQTQLEDGKTPDMSHISWEKYENHFFGTGLFTLEERENDWEVKLKINPNSWYLNDSLTQDRALSWISRFGDYSNSPEYLQVKEVIDNNISKYKFTKGEFDISSLSIYEDEQVINDLQTNPLIEVVSKPSDRMSMLCFNIRPISYYIGYLDPCEWNPEYTKGWAVRRAICYAIDRTEINNVVHGGKKDIIDHPLTLNQGKWCHPNIIRYCHNKEVADLYMYHAGFDLGWTPCIGGPGYNNNPSELPDWEDVCEDKIEIITLTINDFSFVNITFILCSLITVYVIYSRLKKRRKKYDKN